MKKSNFYINNPYIILFRHMYEIFVKNSEASIVWVGYNDWLAREKKQLDILGIKISSVLTERISRELFITYSEIYPIEYSRVLVNENNIYLYSQDNDDLAKQLIKNGINQDRIFRLPTIEELANICSEKERADIGDGIILDTRQIQSITLKALHFFSKLCEEKGYKYFLDGGTLLGAVRHKGFIPWDDDADVYMPYEDYCRLREEFIDSEDYELLTWDRTDGYPFVFAKIVDKNTYLVHDGGIVMGVYIDIFPLVEYPNDIDSIYSLWCKYSEWDKKWDEYNLLNQVGIKNEDIRGEIEKKRAESDGEGLYVGDILYIQKKPWTTSSKVFEKYIMLPFERYEFRCPAGYDIYLRERYGDYMQLPPREERAVHSFPAYANKKYVRDTLKEYKIKYDMKFVIENSLIVRIWNRVKNKR